MSYQQQQAQVLRMNLGGTRYLDLPSLPADLAAILIEGKAGNVESIDLSRCCTSQTCFVLHAA